MNADGGTLTHEHPANLHATQVAWTLERLCPNQTKATPGQRYYSVIVLTPAPGGAEQFMPARCHVVLSLAGSLLVVAGAGRPLEGQGTAPAPIHAVIGVTANVSVGDYRGPCPAKLLFTGTITAAAIPKVPITYQWLRSDNTQGPKRTLKMTSATATVTTPWRLSRPGEMMRVWQKLQILAPTSITSNQADAAVLCN